MRLNCENETLLVNEELINNYETLKLLYSLGENHKVPKTIFNACKKITTTDEIKLYTSFNKEDLNDISLLGGKFKYDTEYISLYMREKEMKNLVGLEGCSSFLYRGKKHNCDISPGKNTFEDTKNKDLKMIYEIFPEEHRNHIVIAGGVVLNRIINTEYNDVDFFLHSCTEEKANEIIRQFHKKLLNLVEKYKIEGEKYRGRDPNIEFNENDENLYDLKLRATYGDNNVTFSLSCVNPGNNTDTIFDIPIRHKYQFILRIYDSPSQVIHGFDVDCCSILYNYKDGLLYTSERGAYSIDRKCNTINFEKLSTSYEYRLVKYLIRGIGVDLPFIEYLEKYNIGEIALEKGLAVILKYLLNEVVDIDLKISNDDLIKKVSDYDSIGDKYTIGKYENNYLNFKKDNPDSQSIGSFHRIILDDVKKWYTPNKKLTKVKKSKSDIVKRYRLSKEEYERKCPYEFLKDLLDTNFINEFLKKYKGKVIASGISVLSSYIGKKFPFFKRYDNNRRLRFNLLFGDDFNDIYNFAREYYKFAFERMAKIKSVKISGFDIDRLEFLLPKISQNDRNNEYISEYEKFNPTIWLVNFTTSTHDYLVELGMEEVLNVPKIEIPMRVFDKPEEVLENLKDNNSNGNFNIYGNLDFSNIIMLPSDKEGGEYWFYRDYENNINELSHDSSCKNYNSRDRIFRILVSKEDNLKYFSKIRERNKNHTSIINFRNNSKRKVFPPTGDIPMKGQFNVITPGNYNHTIGEIFREPILFGRQIGTPTPRPLSPEIPVYGDHVFSDDENSDDEN